MNTGRTGDLRVLGDLQTPWCLRVVVTLGIPARVAAGVAAIEDLARDTGCDQEALHNVLGHLVARGVFEEPAPGRFALNDLARGLLDDGVRIGFDLEGIGGRFAHAWGTLLTYVRTGRSGYAEAFGRPFWDDLDAHPELAASFDALMGPAGHGVPDAEIPLTDGWDHVRTVVDVGGGTGALLAEILRAQPGVRGTLVDLPRTVARARETFEAAGVAERVTMVGQSFFDPLPAGADLYVLKSVLNDWPDGETIAILARCAEAARPAGRIAIMGGVRPDNAPRGFGVDTLLLGSKTNRVAEFRELAARAGLEVIATGVQPSGRLVVECRPV